MIRPFTICCALLAGFSGLFLYSKKHQTTVLDQQISKIVSDTQHIRQQTAMLQTQWALLNQPDRLSHLAARFEPQLQPMAPNQFVRMADLGGHLPAPGSVKTVNPRDEIRATLAASTTPAAPPPATTGPDTAVAVNTMHDDVTPAARPEKKTPMVLARAEQAAAPLPEPRHAATSRPAVLKLASADPAPRPALTSLHHETTKPLPRPVAHTDALAVALGEKSETPHHAAASEPERLAAWHPSRPVVTQAAWHPTAPAAPRYVEARATTTYGGSLLGHTAMGGGLPPPMPVSN